MHQIWFPRTSLHGEHSAHSPKLSCIKGIEKEGKEGNGRGGRGREEVEGGAVKRVRHISAIRPPLALFHSFKCERRQ